MPARKIDRPISDLPIVPWRHNPPNVPRMDHSRLTAPHLPHHHTIPPQTTAHSLRADYSVFCTRPPRPPAFSESWPKLTLQARFARGKRTRSASNPGLDIHSLFLFASRLLCASVMWSASTPLGSTLAVVDKYHTPYAHRRSLLALDETTVMLSSVESTQS